ncbi:E3 ubiquitin-protein ligase DZIP3 [Acropora cervicornis]|uniref:E3 ubiquitin-protein ligase DZIP3 n=1 Tax=Acropora cervicornis TaxID=6130 RepID=A0AAD9R6K3_ACRCE|nr:E3 ubiquitin-protein ligase DZIP3 [Acropora cervicornis]
MSAVLEASEEKTNGTRLARLVIDGGTHALRTLFCTMHPPATLQTVVSKNFLRLQTLKLRRAISDSQWEALFPSSGLPPDAKTFDITLLHLLLREICYLAGPGTGWNNLPIDSDVSSDANIVRIKCYRNELCHSISTGITNAEFKDKWDKISSTLVALGLDQKEINRLKTEPIDHDTERRVKAEVKQWTLDFETQMYNLEQEVKQMKTEISKIQEAFGEKNTKEVLNSLPDEVLEVFGRSEEIEQVIKTIQTERVAAVVITGGPGFGKSTVANKVAHRLAGNQHYKTKVLFCSLRAKTTVNDVATAIILSCNKNHSQPPDNPQHWLLNWRKQQTENVTFVLGNAEDVLESSERPQFISILRDMRTLAQNVSFVVTSRRVFKDSSLNITEVRLKPLLPEDSKEVLISQVKDRTILNRLSKTTELVELCGCVPLALCIVGSLLTDYKEDELIAMLREDESDDNSVEKAIKTSFDVLSKIEKEALVLMSAFPAFLKQIDEYYHLVHSGIKVACTYFISRLTDGGNLYWSKDTCRESIQCFNEDRHNFEYFLKLCSFGLTKKDPDSVAIMENLVMKVSQISSIYLYLEMCLLPNVYVEFLKLSSDLLISSKQPASKQVELLCLLGHESRRAGNFNKYKEFQEKAIEVHSQNPEDFDREKVSDAFFHNNFARYLAYQGKLDEAKEKFDFCLRICEENLSVDYMYVQKGIILLFAGKEANRCNEPHKAELKLNEALGLYQKVLGTHIMTAWVHRYLADFHLFHAEKSLGSPEDRQKSIKLYREALQMMADLGMKDHKECILSLVNLGICH